jgi:hypothetical protein
VRPDYFKYWNLAFAVPSVVYGIVVMRLWARAAYGFNVQHAMTIQNYAYLTAIKDRICGVELQWAASGDQTVHARSHKYRNMRLLCIAWGGASSLGAWPVSSRGASRRASRGGTRCRSSSFPCTTCGSTTTLCYATGRERMGGGAGEWGRVAAWDEQASSRRHRMQQVHWISLVY